MSLASGRCGGAVVAACVMVSLLVTVASSARADSLEDVFRAGNEAYFSGEYDAASARYESLVELGVRDADVFYNLGMSYARQGRHGRAIAAFERALRMRPGDAEAVRALDRSRDTLARRRAEREGEATMASGPELGEAIFGGVSQTSLAVLVLLFDMLFFGVLTAFLFARRETARLALGIAAPLLGIGLTISGIGLAIRSGALDDGTPAIVVRDRVALREGPRDGAGERARAREGESARIVARDGEWVRVRVGGREGWVEAERVVAIE